MDVPVVAIFDSGPYEAHVRRAAGVLDAGGLVAIPTETVYGIAGRLDLASARERLSTLRTGPEPRSPYTIHLDSPERVSRFVGPLGSYARRLVAKLWPGPVGLSFDVPEKHRREVSEQVGVPESELFADGRITLRCPDHPAALDILSITAGPVAVMALTDSAGIAVYRIADALLDGKVDLAIDAGSSRLTKPSTLLRVCDDRYEVIRQGVYDKRTIDKLLKSLVLFVCSGNTCRSPMAEALGRRAVAERMGVGEAALEAIGISVMSAGSFAMPGARATPAAVEAVGQMGLDLSGHRSQPLTVELIHRADRIFTMGSSHSAAVRALVPSADYKVRPLDPDGDIQDPIGGDVRLYQALAARMDALIRSRLDEEPLPGSDSPVTE